MGKREDQRERIREFFKEKKVHSLHGITEHLGIGNRMVQRYLKDLHGLTSYTHKGQFVTLPDIPRFDKHGIWFYRKVGFSEFGNSLSTIVRLIEQSKNGLSREQLEAILKIGISKQIQILLQRERVHRIKLGNRYLYIPEAVMRNKKARLKLVGDRQTEEHFEKGVQNTELIALLKAVLIEKKVGTDIESIKVIAQKYSLRIPLKRIEQLLLKYDLSEKKRHDNGKRTEDDVSER